MIDAFEGRGFPDGGDQPLTNAHASLRPTHSNALDCGYGAIILQHNPGCSDTLGVNQRKKMKGCGVVFIALSIDRNALFSYKNFFSKPEALFELTLCVGGFDRYGVHSCEVSIVLPRHQKLFYVRNSCRPCGKSRQSDSLAACAALESDMTHISGFERSQLLLLPEAIDDYVVADNPVRFIDAFVDELDLAAAGFKRVTPKVTVSL